MTNTIKIPDFITFTGIDERTDLNRAERLARQYPIEWGVLYSASNRDARYPCNQAIREILDVEGSISAHLCGQVAKLAAQGTIPDDIPLAQFNRTQINGHDVQTDNLPALAEKFGVKVILQTRGDAFNPSSPFRELYDRSGGLGIFPAKIPTLGGPGTLVGYAGGMGPDTVLDYLSMIQGEGEFWIDMEGQVRTNGWFDLDKVQRVCELVFDRD